MIRNTNGTPYEPLGKIAFFDPQGPMTGLFNTWDQEAIMMGGSPVYYHEVFIPMATIDPVYNESRGKVWSQHPVELWGLYEPIASQNDLSLFGINSASEIVIEFNKQDVLNRLGREPKVGSRIFTPHLRMNWELVQVNTAEYRMWNVLHYQFYCKQFPENRTDGSIVKQPTPDVTII